MSVSHKNMPDAQRHEPKGISSAPANTVYVSSGTGTGTWTDILADVNNSNLVPYFAVIDDISTASSVFIPSPFLGDIVKVYVTLQGTIATADATVTLEINGVLVAGSTISAVAAGSVAGTTFEATPTGSNTVAEGGTIEIITDGASTNAVAATVCILVDVS